MFLVCDHVTAKYFLIQPCKSRDGSDDQNSRTTHSVALRGNACGVIDLYQLIELVEGLLSVFGGLKKGASRSVVARLRILPLSR